MIKIKGIFKVDSLLAVRHGLAAQSIPIDPFVASVCKFTPVLCAADSQVGCPSNASYNLGTQVLFEVYLDFECLMNAKSSGRIGQLQKS
jgi:hypothetical protein